MGLCPQRPLILFLLLLSNLVNLGTVPSNFPIEPRGVLLAGDPVEIALLNVDACSVLLHLVEAGVAIPVASRNNADDANIDESKNKSFGWILLSFICSMLVVKKSSDSGDVVAKDNKNGTSHSLA